MFQPYPSEIYFQRYEPFNTYEVPLLLRNNDKVPRLVKVTQVDTPYFKIVASADAHQKIGPGLPVVYHIQFTPEENKDYNHELVVITEREKFLLPIRCVGARAILDFPDAIHFGASPVKHKNTRVLLVRNVGNADAKFAVDVQAPFSVWPTHGILPVGENMQVSVDFQPSKCDDFTGELTVKYDSGDLIVVGLHGTAQDVNVRLDKNSIRIEDTYITMSNQRTVTLHNRSDIIVHFAWKRFATADEEQQQKLREINMLTLDESNAKSKLALTSSHNQLQPNGNNNNNNQSTSAHNHDYVALLTRNFQNKMRNAQAKSLLFEDNVFFIQPLEGEIWPQSSVDINVIFKPDYAQAYNKTAFCEVVGRESRLPLRLSGVGAGPRVQLSIELLDLGHIFIGSTHVYEVVMANKSFIDAIFTLVVAKTQFGKLFSFEPNEGIISPGGYQSISIVFNGARLGEFDETFECVIDGRPDKYKLNIKGHVIPPTFQFDMQQVQFGLVSYGKAFFSNEKY